MIGAANKVRRANPPIDLIPPEIPGVPIINAGAACAEADPEISLSEPRIVPKRLIYEAIVRGLQSVQMLPNL